MSDQEPGHGHHAITQVAVHSLFSDVPEGGKLLGHTEKEFFSQLDHCQDYADGFPLGMESHGHVNRLDGDTYITSSLAPDAQAKHAVSDPSKSAGWNLDKIHNYIVDSLMTARSCHLHGDREGEWQALGAAIHCLQDSYSSAHMFRDPTHPDDPNASIQAINTFSYGFLGDNYRNGDTHEEVFDKVPMTDGRLERATDRASADASTTIMQIYIHQLHSTEDGAYDAFIVALDPLFHGPHATVFNHRLAYEMDPVLGPRSLGYNDPACRPSGRSGDD